MYIYVYAFDLCDFVKLHRDTGPMEKFVSIRGYACFDPWKSFHDLDQNFKYYHALLGRKSDAKSNNEPGQNLNPYIL